MYHKIKKAYQRRLDSNKLKNHGNQHYCVLQLMLILFLILANPNPSYAYSIQSHRLITRMAIQQYNTCAATVGIAPLPENFANEFADNNVKEDTNLIRKAFNWHFYTPGKVHGKGKLGLGHASLSHRFQKLEAQLPSKSIIDGWETLSRMSHYVQDVTNPAHVVPIYHLGHDNFDQFDFENNLPEPLDEEECQAVLKSADPRSYFELLDATAKHTLEVIKEEVEIKTNDGKSLKLPWMVLFWSPTHGPGSKRKTYGQYGILGNTFGEQEPAAFSLVAKNTPFAVFASARFREAIIATMIFYRKFAENTHKLPPLSVGKT